MHSHDIHKDNQKRTGIVVFITVITMILEIVYGFLTGSMALLADGFHMGTHALALGLALVAYFLEEKFLNSPEFPNGTDKIGALSAYTSSLFLGITGIMIIFEAVKRLFTPEIIRFDEAITVAVIGLIVNVVCIFIMENKEHSEHEDFNFKAAYYHILADALTSVLAIVALFAGKFYNLVLFDALVGILGGVMILRWAYGLIKDTTKILIDFSDEAREHHH